MNILVTGGAGFIGSALIRMLIHSTNYNVINVDKLTYAGNLESLSEVSDSSRYKFEKKDICNLSDIKIVFESHQPDRIIHLAAESHVDRSIDAADDFINTNIIGTYNLLEVAKDYWSGLEGRKKDQFRFLHISTDEVYGDLGETKDYFREDTPYSPSSPYSASKASSDHLVRAWHRTYNMPTIVTNCSNNYGPFQFPEKLIPNVILKALSHKEISVYGDGGQIRDWLYVDDHVFALLKVIENGKLGDTYNIGGNNEKTNLEVVKTICFILDEIRPSQTLGNYAELIGYVEDRPGHDRRYAIDASKISSDLGWQPKEDFESGIRKTINWFLDNEAWWNPLLAKGSLQRLGMKKTN